MLAALNEIAVAPNTRTLVLSYTGTGNSEQFIGLLANGTSDFYFEVTYTPQGGSEIFNYRYCTSDYDRNAFITDKPKTMVLNDVVKVYAYHKEQVQQYCYVTILGG